MLQESADKGVQMLGLMTGHYHFLFPFFFQAKKKKGKKNATGEKRKIVEKFGRPAVQLI